ncbi:hypothetical protein AB0305_03725 [Arthrobacter sp. NPDC080086]|uniref:hypothetical protein n=1 Tax=Arthrobacter sp. NPDC080086 TaxID=3155917 RepID=UPI00344F961D
MMKLFGRFDGVVKWVTALFLGLVAAGLVQAWQQFRGVPVEREHVPTADLFLDAVRVDCPADPAYAHASECIRTRRGVGFFFVDDNGVPRVVAVVGVGRVE